MIYRNIGFQKIFLKFNIDILHASPASVGDPQSHDGNKGIDVVAH